LFNQLNEDKCEAVYYLLFKDSKYRLGLIGGVRDNVFTSPFKTKGLMLETEPGPVPCVVVAAICISPYKNEHMYI
jgi:hypothetical protein